MTVLFVLAALLMLGIMVLVHECGHFFAARLTGIPVRAFGIGFGPEIAHWKGKKHETAFSLRLIPAGGYCAFYGEDQPDDEKRKDPRALNNYPVWKRLLTIVMGPVMNFVLALVVAVCFYAVAGEQTDVIYGRVRIESVNAGSPAQVAGLAPGDLIESVNGQETYGLNESGQQKALAAIAAYQEGDAPLEMTVTRGDEKVTLSLTPAYNAEEGRMMIGVTTTTEYTPVMRPCTLGRAVQLGTCYCVEAGSAILVALKKLVTTGEGAADTGGPVRIIQVITEETRAYGWEAYISLLVMISVNLGLVNLLPIPGLDGSRAVFLIIEGIFRKPVPQKVEAYIHLAGYAVLMVLFLILTYRDIVRLFQ